MASTLKRKRGPVEVAESLKRKKSSKQKGLSTVIAGSPKAGLEAIFGPNSSDALAKVNGGTSNGPIDEAESNGSGVEDFEEYSQRSKNSHNKIETLKKEASRARRPEWKLSTSVGGRMIDVDPVFADDEKYILIAHKKSIKVYLTSTSLQIRSISLRKDKGIEQEAEIVAYALSHTQPNMIWVACSDGAVYNLDWTTGKGADQFWTTSSMGIIHMTAASMTSAGRRRDVIFTTEERRDGGWRITAHELTPPGSSIATVARTIYTSAHPIQILKASENGLIITAASGKRILVGALRSTEFDTVDKIRFEFRMFESTAYVSCLDFRVSSRSSPGAKKQRYEKVEILDLVVGDVRGAIFVHNDLLANMIRLQEAPTSGINLTPRKLHWHRKAVHSVKWSLDGNYIISGGTETVMVLWQLDTGRQQFLPHMSAAIQNILVSPGGTSYAVRLADNSTMVLSTTELKPTANISGVQSYVIRNARSLESRVSRVGRETRETSLLPRTPVVISPSMPSRLLLAVSEQQEVDPVRVVSAPFLQTFDIASSHTVSRQALTRTNAIHANIAPDAHSISEPKVAHMKISHDGKWLVTVDEWIPPRRDIELLGHSGSNVETEQRKRLEVYLKFWQWKKSSETWELVSRVDGPHTTARDHAVTGSILDLASDPASTSFSTLGEDGVICIWRLKTRVRDGVSVRGADGEPLCNWTCHKRILLNRDDEALTSVDPRNSKLPRIENGCLAFSGDGSVLAAAMTGNQDGLIHIIDPLTGTLQSSLTNIYHGDIIKMALLAQYLVLVSDDLRVYDLVLDELNYGITLSNFKSDLKLEQKTEMMHLAIDNDSQTFAIAVPYKQQWRTSDSKVSHALVGAYSEVAIFDPYNSGPLITQALPHLITALLPTVDSAGYLIVDDAAEITTIGPKATQSLTSTAKPMVDLRLDFKTEDTPAADLMQLAEDDMEETLDEPAEDIFMNDGMDDDATPYFTQQQLSNLFDVGPSFAMPPVEEMFYRVADLVSAKMNGGLI